MVVWVTGRVWRADTGLKIITGIHCFLWLWTTPRGSTRDEPRFRWDTSICGTRTVHRLLKRWICKIWAVLALYQVVGKRGIWIHEIRIIHQLLRIWLCKIWVILALYCPWLEWLSGEELCVPILHQDFQWRGWWSEQISILPIGGFRWPSHLLEKLGRFNVTIAQCCHLANEILLEIWAHHSQCVESISYKKAKRAELCAKQFQVQRWTQNCLAYMQLCMQPHIACLSALHHPCPCHRARRHQSR